MVVMAPADEAECRRMLQTAYEYPGPALVRYPRGAGPGVAVGTGLETLPLRLDRVLRLVLVTPDMHRVHHSSDMRETDTNYGFNFPFWDRIFRTYTDQPRLGHNGMEIGLTQYRKPETANLGWTLLLPFRGKSGR